MNSSISSSDAASWRRFSVTLVAVAAAVLAGLLALAYVLDPYDTGRSGLLSKPGVRPQGPRTANASRGRDPAFNAMIVGNSRIQLLSPERLRERTGLDFVQLSVPGSGPKEQLTLIDWFMRHRIGPPKAIVVSIDSTWCTSNPALTGDRPFPFWLYSDNPFDYAKGLLRLNVLEELPRHLAYFLQENAERARPDGYWDYEPEYAATGRLQDPALRERLEQNPLADAPRFDSDPRKEERSFPAAERLRDLAGGLAPDTALILVVPPVYRNAAPPPGTAQAYRLQACKEAMETAVRGHPRAAWVDWSEGKPETADSRLFFDPIHYGHPIARRIEADIAEALRRFR